MKKILFLAVTAVVLLTGCFQQEKVTKKIVMSENPLSEVAVSEEFDFKSTAEVTTGAFTITSQNLAGEEFAVYEGEDTKGLPILEGAFGEDQTYNIELPILEGVKNVTVVSKSGSFETFKADVVDNKIAFNCKKTNVSSLAKRGTTVGTSVIDPTRWKALIVKGTLAFEDKWPLKGDYDFNDVVINYALFKVLNVFSGKIVGIDYNFWPAASGASLNDGFGIELNGIKNSDIGSAFLLKNILNVSSFRAEALDKPTFIFTDNVKTLFDNYDGNGHIYNTVKSEKYYGTDLYSFIVLFKKGIVYDSFDYKSINPFITVGGDRSKEVHLKGFAPTALADKSLFGTGDDGSTLSKGYYYMTNDGNKPWALDIPCSWAYPVEAVSISDAYPHFIRWAVSEGKENKNWYKTGNRELVY